MKNRGRGPTVGAVARFFEELSSPGQGPAPPVVRALRAIGFVAMTFVVVVAATTEPRPALHGPGLWVAIALATLVAGLLMTFRRGALRPGVRFAGLVLVAAASAVLAGFQPGAAAIGGVYYVLSIAALRLRRAAAVTVIAVAVAGQLAALALGDGGDAGSLAGFLFSVLPWFLIMRLVRELRLGRDRAEGLVAELRESRAAHAEAAALAERGRVARDMHDVLAHSLSALALQLEGARLLARDRGTDPAVVTAVERAHHLAREGLDEARRAIGALRGDELPGPERLQALADAFAEQAGARCRLTVAGTPRELPSEARLALYRTAQEALTNVRRHSAADRVDLALEYKPDATTLVVRDHGPGAPVAAAGGSGGGYGLTGMRERAELLGGRLRAGPSDDGFRVELWLPA